MIIFLLVLLTIGIFAEVDATDDHKEHDHQSPAQKGFVGSAIDTASYAASYLNPWAYGKSNKQHPNHYIIPIKGCSRPMHRFPPFPPYERILKGVELVEGPEPRRNVWEQLVAIHNNYDMSIDQISAAANEVLNRLPDDIYKKLPILPPWDNPSLPSWATKEIRAVFHAKMSVLEKQLEVSKIANRLEEEDKCKLRLNVVNQLPEEVIKQIDAINWKEFSLEDQVKKGDHQEQLWKDFWHIIDNMKPEYKKQHKAKMELALNPEKQNISGLAAALWERMQGMFMFW